MVTTLSKQAGRRWTVAGLGGASVNGGFTSKLGVKGTLTPAVTAGINALFVMLTGGPTLFRAGTASSRVGE